MNDTSKNDGLTATIVAVVFLTVIGIAAGFLFYFQARQSALMEMERALQERDAATVAMERAQLAEKKARELADKARSDYEERVSNESPESSEN